MENHQKKQLLLACLLLGCIVTSLVNSSVDFKEVGEKPKTEVIKASEIEKKGFKEKKTGSKESKKEILVQVSGAVVRPGVYLLPVDSGLEEALLMAGGVTEEADTEKLNYARRLKEGAMIYVPYKKAAKGSSEKNTLRPRNGEGKNKSGKKVGKGNGIVNLNTASQQELESLPGIGPAMAVQIISRRQLKPFSRVEELLEIRGIGQAKLERLRALVRV